MKKNYKLTMNIGIISFLMMFIILCMLTFSLLSLLSAKSNRDIASTSIEHKSSYYVLLNEGEQALKTIDDALYALYQKYPDKDAYFKHIDSLLPLLDGASIQNDKLTFEIKNDKQKLQVELQILFPGTMFYEILSWKTSPLADWNPDHSLNVL